MAVSLRSSSLNTYSTSTSVTYTAPSGVASGDLLVAVFALGANRTITPPTGFTAVVSPLALTGSASGYYLFGYSKIADGTETTLTFYLSASTDHSGYMAAYSGVDGTTPFDVSPSSAVGASSSLSAPSLTTVTANAVVAWFAYNWFPFSGSETASSGFTWRLTPDPGGHALQDETQATAGATGAVAVALVGVKPWAVFMAALRPASGGGGIDYSHTKLGSTSLSALYLGSTSISKLYLGSTTIF